MSDDAKAPERVTFSRGYGVCIMGIDGACAPESRSSTGH
jgi:hypothetical protein